MKYSDWKNQPATQKQLDYIAYMHEFSSFPVPKFTGKTKGEAALYIDKYAKEAHKSDWAIVNGYE